MRIDTVLLLLNDSSLEPRTTFNVPVYSVSYDQQILKITRDHWAQQVLQRWNRGVGIPIVISLPEVFLSEDRANIARFLKEAWQKIDGGDYQGAFMDARKSIELIRKLLNSPEQPIPDSKNDRDINQRLHAVSQALFGFASAAVHSDEAILDYLPSREDAVALVGSTAALAQAVFARLNSGGQ
ncbi:MAG: hypothetical protein M1399_04325 [Actinobacteria bacterium]|nr:hypothetical protein [Actinomycetota bacterium]MCL5447496.1 hypothetical protein [Actinomycetota bacterium]